MTDAPKKAIRWIPGDTVARAVENTADRTVTVVWGCAWLFVGGWAFLKNSAPPAGSQSSPFMSIIWVPFLLWLIVLLLLCLLIAWSFFGSTKFSISSDELTIRKCLDGVPIFTYASIKLSTIADVSAEERSYNLKNRTVPYWRVLARSEDGETHQVAEFFNKSAAHELMSKLLYAEN